MSKTTYSVVQRNPNSYCIRNDGSRVYEYVRDCGHQHRTLSGVERCLARLCRKDELGGISELGYFGQMEDAKGNIIEPFESARQGRNHTEVIGTLPEKSDSSST